MKKGRLERLTTRDLMALAWFARRAAGFQGAGSTSFDPRAEMRQAYMVADSELKDRRRK